MDVWVGTLADDDVIDSGIVEVEEAIEGIEDAQKECVEYGERITREFNSAKRKVSLLDGDVSKLHVKQDNEHKVCNEPCEVKFRGWCGCIPSAKPSGCFKRTFKRLAACIEKALLGAAIVAIKVLIEAANFILDKAKILVDGILAAINEIMEAALDIVTLVLVALKALRDALIFTLNMVRKVDDLRPSVTCSGINAGKFAAGFYAMDILLMNEFVFSMVRRRNVQVVVGVLAMRP